MQKIILQLVLMPLRAFVDSDTIVEHALDLYSVRLNALTGIC